MPEPESSVVDGPDSSGALSSGDVAVVTEVDVLSAFDVGTLTEGDPVVPPADGVVVTVVVAVTGAWPEPWLPDPLFVTVVVGSAPPMVVGTVTDSAVDGLAEPALARSGIVLADTGTDMPSLGSSACLPGLVHTDRVVSLPGLAKRASRTANTDPPAAAAVMTHNNETGTVLRRDSTRRGRPITSRTVAALALGAPVNTESMWAG